MEIIEAKTFSQNTYYAVCQLTKQLSPEQMELDESSFRAILDSENSHLLLMRDTYENIIGMLTIGVYRSPTGYKAWIEDVVIDDAYRGHGYGKILVKNAIDFIRNLDVDTILLTSNSSRIIANKLYQALNFSLYKTNVYKMRFL
jgi:ribosomal protein S18 acetylase RimI-like enzyme